MFTAFPCEQVLEIASLFPGPQLRMVLASVAEGNTAAHCWTTPETQDAALLWDKGNVVLYLAGDVSSPVVAEALAELVSGTIWPMAAKEGLRFFSASAFSPDSEQIVTRIFGDAELKPSTKRFYTYERSEAGPTAEPALDGVQFLPIDMDLLGGRLANARQIEAEVRWMWPDIDRFHRYGIGVAARWEDKLVCWCTAEYLSRDLCGIGIETVAEFQGRNIATATAARFVAECLARDIQPHWECSAGNPASARVAEKVGFTLASESTYWTGRFPEVS